MNVSTNPSAAAPAPTAPVAQQGGETAPGLTRVNVPLDIPQDMTQVDPKSGRMPIDDYQVQLLPKDAIITNQGEVQKLVQQIKDETLPEGMMPKIADSGAGAVVAKGKAAVGSVGQMAGGIGLYNLAGFGSWGLSAALASQLAGIGGGIGLLMSADQLKEALDSKAFFENLKAKGTTHIPVPALVTNAEGKTVQGFQEMAIDDVISAQKDKSIMHGATMVSSVGMIAAALGAPPLVAVGAVVVGLGGILFGFKGLFKALGSKIADKFRGNKEQEPQQVVKANAPEVKAAKDASPAPAPAAVPEGPKGMTPEEITQTVGRIQELQMSLVANPQIAGQIQRMQELFPQAAAQDAKALEELGKLEKSVLDDPSAGPVYKELQGLQVALQSDPTFLQMLAEEQAAAAAAQAKA